MMIITTLTLCALAMLHIVLSFLIIGIRRKQRIGLNHGDDPALAASMRSQANNMEYSIWFVPLLALAENQHVGVMTLGVIASVYMVARLWHAYAFVMTKGSVSKGRVAGTVLSVVAIISLIVINLTRLCC